MHYRKLLLLAALLSAPLAHAQTATKSDSSVDAARFRADLVASIVNRTASTDAALSTLKSRGSPWGMALAHDAEVGFAAVDVGQRLLVVHQPAEAEVFFRAAEAALTTMIDGTPDRAARDKAQFLGARAHVRANFLNREQGAKQDIDAALVLRPEDEQLRTLRRVLANGRSAIFRDQPQG